MKQTGTDLQLDRRSVLLLGMAGAAAAIVGPGAGALAADVPVQQLAPGVTLKVLKEVDSRIPGYSKVRLGELTFEPGSTFGPETLKSISVCEISGGPLEVHFEGQEPFTLQPGDIYNCNVGLVETDMNKGSARCIMRFVELDPA